MTQTLARMERPLNNSSADPKRGVPAVIVNGAHPFCHSERSEESRASACKAAMALDEPSGFFAEFILNAAEGKGLISLSPYFAPESDSFLGLRQNLAFAFSLVLNITLETNPPSQAQHNSTVNRHLTTFSRLTCRFTTPQNRLMSSYDRR